MTCNVAFIGLGVMGYPMAGYISKGGHNVTVFNRTKSKAEKWVKEYKGKMAETPAEAAKAVSYTHLRAHETEADLVCRLLLEKKK